MVRLSLPSAAGELYKHCLLLETQSCLFTGFSARGRFAHEGRQHLPIPQQNETPMSSLAEGKWNHIRHKSNPLVSELRGLLKGWSVLSLSKCEAVAKTVTSSPGDRGDTLVTPLTSGVCPEGLSPSRAGALPAQFWVCHSSGISPPRDKEHFPSWIVPVASWFPHSESHPENQGVVTWYIHSPALLLRAFN